jgi:hypothetical protein
MANIYYSSPYDTSSSYQSSPIPDFFPPPSNITFYNENEYQNFSSSLFSYSQPFSLSPSVSQSFETNELYLDQSSYQEPSDSNYFLEITKAYTTISDLSPNEGWIADSGATDHMTDQLQWFHTYRPLPVNTLWPVETPTGNKCYVQGTSDIKIPFSYLSVQRYIC